MKAKDKLLKARSFLILDHPFFGSLALKLALVEDASFPTAAVDGKSLFYNPEFIEKLSTSETIGLIAHEVMHVALGHIWRIGSRDMENWNIAADYTINSNLVSTGFTLPEGALNDSAYNDLSAEEIYGKLPQKKKSKNGKGECKDGKKGNGKSDPGGCGGVTKPKNKESNKTASAKEMKELKGEWDAAVSQAAQISKGKLPSTIKRLINEILNPIVPWFILLRDFVEKSARNDYDWTRPSRRYINRGIILPSLVSEELPEVVIAIDTSGSINQHALTRFAAEASNILGVYDTTIRIMYCNSQIQKEETFTRADLPLKMNPSGGGGTSFKPVFKKLYKEGTQPACLIYFTDLYGDFPTLEPDYPVMWLTTTEDGNAPFGKVVQFKE